jgi:DNA-binding response OmpR family regulator
VSATGLVWDVLLVEDEVALAEMYRIKLQAAGHRVRIAGDGPTGLREALERPPQVLLLDIRLPGFDGLELLTRLREDVRGASLPVIVVSNYGEPEIVERVAELGALAHLVKSQTTPGSLTETIEHLLGGRLAGLSGT